MRAFPVRASRATAIRRPGRTEAHLVHLSNFA